MKWKDVDVRELVEHDEWHGEIIRRIKYKGGEHLQWRLPSENDYEGGPNGAMDHSGLVGSLEWLGYGGPDGDDNAGILCRYTEPDGSIIATTIMDTHEDADKAAMPVTEDPVIIRCLWDKEYAESVNFKLFV